MSGMQPFDFAAAHRAAGNATIAQEQAENIFKQCARDFAQKEERYRVALAKEIVRQHADEKVAWSVASDVARGEPEVARLRMERDIAEGMKEAAGQALWRQTANRRDLGRFIDWSMRIDVGVHIHGDAEHEPENVRPIGAAA